MLLVNGDPTLDINVPKDYEHNLLVIIKNGKIWKNILPSRAARFGEDAPSAWHLMNPS